MAGSHRSSAVEGFEPRRARQVAQATADAARRETAAARAAVVDTASSSAATRDAAQAALTTSLVGLRAAVDALALLSGPDGQDDVAPIDIVRSADGSSVTVRPRGDLDLLTCPHLEQVATSQLDAGVDRLVMDLSEVAFLDSSALAVLVEVHHVALENQTEFVVTGLIPRQRRLLEITRLDQVLTVW